MISPDKISTITLTKTRIAMKTKMKMNQKYHIQTGKNSKLFRITIKKKKHNSNPKIPQLPKIKTLTSNQNN